MKTTQKIAALAAGMALTFGLFVGQALAMTPTLSVTSTGNNSYNQYQVTVNGDANQGINLYYYNGSTIAPAIFLGTTNSNGYFTTTISQSNYNIPSGANTYVVVNNQQSPYITWPYTNGNGSTVTLSQSTVNLAVGQTQSVTIYGGSGSYYISSNTNSNIVTSSISGNTINLYGENIGSTDISICSSNGGYGCVTLYATVGGSGYGNTIYLSQSSVTLSTGQSTIVTINGGTGSYYISSNTNSNVASASVSGNTITIYGSAIGSTNVNICSYTGGSSCVSLYVNVAYGNGNNNGQSVILSQNTLAMYVGQSQTITLSGSGSYYISSNSNSNVTTTGINGNSLTVYGAGVGASNISICSSNSVYNGNYYGSNCAILYVGVQANGGYYNNSYPTGSNTSGVYLSQVPYTGGGASAAVISFIVLLGLWSSALAYYILTGKNPLFAFEGGASSESQNLSMKERINKFKEENFKKKNS